MKCPLRTIKRSTDVEDQYYRRVREETTEFDECIGSECVAFSKTPTATPDVDAVTIGYRVSCKYFRNENDKV